MRLRFFFLSVILLSIISLTNAQRDSLLYKYNNQTIYRFGTNFTKGAERLTFRELQNEFLTSDLGFVSYVKAKRYKKVSGVLRIASFLAGVASVSFIANNGNRVTASLLLGSQAVLGLGSIRYYQQYTQNLDRALWQRNKDILFQK